MAVFNTINALANSSATTGSVKDTNQPYSFQDWKQRNTNISPLDAFAQYDSYLKGWYVKRDLAKVVSVSYVKEYYKTFLHTLGITARDDDEKELFENVDLDSDASLQSVIVGYARRLKDITIYLANKRNDIIYSKLKSNLTGTSLSLERLFYSYILNAFTRKITPDATITTSFVISSPDILSSLPYLNSIASSFSIKIEEVYDTNNYFDRDPSVDLSNYTTTVSGVPDALYASGIYNSVETLAAVGEYSAPEAYLILNAIEAVANATVLTTTTVLPTYFSSIGDGLTTTFNLTSITSNIASDYQVSIDGVVQTPTTAYTISVINQTITFVEPPPINTVVVIVKRY